MSEWNEKDAAEREYFNAVESYQEEITTLQTELKQLREQIAIWIEHEDTAPHAGCICKWCSLLSYNAKLQESRQQLFEDATINYNRALQAEQQLAIIKEQADASSV